MLACDLALQSHGLEVQGVCFMMVVAVSLFVPWLACLFFKNG